jgi:biotin carboxyl carrier protein
VMPVVDASSGPRQEAGGPRLVAPMPGLVVSVEVIEGAAVTAGQTVVVMEAMKVVMRLQAPLGGRVLRIACATGETVKGGDLLIEIDPDEVA